MSTDPQSQSRAKAKLEDLKLEPFVVGSGVALLPFLLWRRRRS